MMLIADSRASLSHSAVYPWRWARHCGTIQDRMTFLTLDRELPFTAICTLRNTAHRTGKLISRPVRRLIFWMLLPDLCHRVPGGLLLMGAETRREDPIF